ncbi:MAG: hypothetical protein J3R72DRAFT_446220 [Linnemannia gamsii]|nr:MAG: hypothetical protein J3R72DRAFT_446220 [Linnemannia gamsii]
MTFPPTTPPSLSSSNLPSFFPRLHFISDLSFFLWSLFSFTFSSPSFSSFNILLRNTMDNNSVTLFCIVDGDLQSKSFSVKPKRADTISDLKALISNELKDDKPSKDLTLWRVFIPGDTPDTAITADALNDKLGLTNPRALISNLFPESPDENTYILVQRPWPASLTQLKSVQEDDIEKELTGILEAVDCHHTTHVVDPKDVEAAQRKSLGPFYKRPLPYRKRATDTSLVMLKLGTDKQAKTDDNKTLRSIVEGDIHLDQFDRRRVVAMVAPSGSGKTATVIDLARYHFVVYCVCCFSRPITVAPEFEDSNFITLANDVEDIYSTISRKPGALLNLQEVDSAVKKSVQGRIELEFLARLLFLQLLLNYNRNLEPLHFFLEQINGGASTIALLVKTLREYNIDTIRLMLNGVQGKLHSLLDPRECGLVIALDEAQVAVTHILSGKLLSPTAEGMGMDQLLDHKNQIQSQYRRGFLTPLSATLSKMPATLVILGTALSLQNADQVYSAVGRSTNFTRITDFPQLDEEDVIKMLSDLVDMSDCDIPSAKRRKLSGRARFSIGIINRLVATGSTQACKQATLDNAINYTIEHVKGALRSGVRPILQSDQTGEAARLLCRMVLAYRLSDAKISFSSQQQYDFVDKALCRLKPHSDGIHLIMDEPLVVEAVEDELQASYKDPTFLEYLDQIYRIIDNFGIASTSKGNALEPLVRRSLQRFNGYRLVDLPFLRNVALPIWCNTVQFQIDSINTAKGFGYTASGLRADLAFLSECPPNKMLIAGHGTRPDGAWFFSDRRYAGSLAIKFYSNRLAVSLHETNETSSDIRDCFLAADGKSNPSLQVIRRDFEDSGTPSNLKGILRIHVEFPDVQKGMPNTHTRRDPVTGVEDVMVYINLSNMDDFFFEGIPEHKDDMAQLKRLIRFVCKE